MDPGSPSWVGADSIGSNKDRKNEWRKIVTKNTLKELAKQSC